MLANSTAPLTTRAWSGPTIVRWVVRVPASSTDPVGTLIPMAGRSDCNSSIGSLSPASFRSKLALAGSWGLMGPAFPSIFRVACPGRLALRVKANSFKNLV